MKRTALIGLFSRPAKYSKQTLSEESSFPAIYFGVGLEIKEEVNDTPYSR